MKQGGHTMAALPQGGAKEVTPSRNEKKIEYILLEFPCFREQHSTCIYCYFLCAKLALAIFKAKINTAVPVFKKETV